MSRLLALFDYVPVLLDGAWATELQEFGLPPATAGDSWNLERPEAVLAVARSYVAAGSRLILTNTFRANPVSLGELALSDQLEAINRGGVELSRRAAAEGGGVRVFGSVGPIRFSGPVGACERARLRGAFRAQVRVLAEAGVDGLALETFGEPQEAELALEAALGTGLPTVVSFAIGPGLAAGSVDPAAVGSPIGIEVVSSRMEALGADGVGANCGIGPSDAAGVAVRLRSSCGLPIWLKPNGGSAGARGAARQDGRFAAELAKAAAAGASFVGGCCGSTPGSIRMLAGALGRP